MNSPCETCLVAPCCSKRCRDYAIYIYETREYVGAGEIVERNISKMPYEEAIEHILEVENTYLYWAK